MGNTTSFPPTLSPTVKIIYNRTFVWFPTALHHSANICFIGICKYQCKPEENYLVYYITHANVFDTFTKLLSENDSSPCSSSPPVLCFVSKQAYQLLKLSVHILSA